MPERIEIRLTYRGPAVDDGTIPLPDLVHALAGVTEAYRKVAAKSYLQVSDELRLSAFESESFAPVFLPAAAKAARWVKQGQV